MLSFQCFGLTHGIGVLGVCMDLTYRTFCIDLEMWSGLFSPSYNAVRFGGFFTQKQYIQVICSPVCILLP